MVMDLQLEFVWKPEPDEFDRDFEFEIIAIRELIPNL